jgi:hypothetical protein
VLHPRYKENYFRKAGWEAGWVERARKIAQQRYTEFYKPEEEYAQAVKEVSLVYLSVPPFGILTYLLQKSGEEDIMVLDLDDDDDECTEDELGSFLSERRITTPIDPIKFWKARLPSPLARMALDILSAPGKHKCIL